MKKSRLISLFFIFFLTEVFLFPAFSDRQNIKLIAADPKAALDTSASNFSSDKLTANLDANGSLPRSTPEKQGISSDAVAETIRTLNEKINTMNSFMLVRHGKVVAECWWAPHTSKTLHAFYSLSKSYTSTAIGMAAAEGKLSLDDPVIKFFPNDLPEKISDNLKK